MNLSMSRFTELVLATVSIIFGVAIWWPGELAPRASSFVGLVRFLPRWCWGASFAGLGLVLLLASTRFVNYRWRRQANAALAVIWCMATGSFLANGVRVLGVILYAVMVLLLAGNFLLMPPLKKGTSANELVIDPPVLDTSAGRHSLL